MKYDVTQVLKGFDGRELKYTNEEGQRQDMTLRWSCCNALVSAYEDERSLTGVEKFNRHLLACKIHEQDEVDLTPEEVVLIKKLVAKGYNAAVVGPIWSALGA